METPVGGRRGWRRVARWVGATVLALLVLGYGGISLVSAHILTQPSNRAHMVDPRQVGEGAQPWRVRTRDGLMLRGWYFPTQERRHLVVLVHGMHATWDDLAGLGRDLHRKGYDILLFDLRGHGVSDASRLSMGYRERDDLRAVLAWAKSASFEPERIGWVGQSMGAATLLLEGAGNREIRAVVLDSPYGDLPELLDRQLTAHSGLPRIFNPGITFAARWAFGVRTDELVPIRVAPRWSGRPVLVIHGQADTMVPVHQAQRLARAAGPNCRSVILPGVEHVEAYTRYPRAYVAAVDRFFERHLAR